MVTTPTDCECANQNQPIDRMVLTLGNHQPSDSSVVVASTSGKAPYVFYNQQTKDTDDFYHIVPESVVLKRLGKNSTKLQRERMREALAQRLKDKYGTGNTATPTADEVRVPRGHHFIPVPPSLTSDIERDVYLLLGQSGSGKSFLASHLLNSYRTMKGKERVYVITDVTDEKFQPCQYLNIDKIVQIGQEYKKQDQHYTRAKTKFDAIKSTIKDPVKKAEIKAKIQSLKPTPSLKNKMDFLMDEDAYNNIFQDSVVLFDDFEDNPASNRIRFLQQHLLNKGRHLRCSLIVCQHMLNSNHDRLLLRELNAFVLYNSGTARDRENYLRDCFGMSKSGITIIETRLGRSRSVCWDKRLNLLISQHIVESLHAE